MKSIQASARTDATESPDPILALTGVVKPEILRYSNRQFGPIGADSGQLEKDFGAFPGLAGQQICPKTPGNLPSSGGIGRAERADHFETGGGGATGYKRSTGWSLGEHRASAVGKRTGKAKVSGCSDAGASLIRQSPKSHHIANNA
jgi:hypothetical protein